MTKTMNHEIFMATEAVWKAKGVAYGVDPVAVSVLWSVKSGTCEKMHR